VILQKGSPQLGNRVATMQPRKVARDGSLGNSISNFNSSPWMRGAPQVGFSLAMVWTEARTSRAMNGLPACSLRDRKRQYRRKPLRCQRAMLSGLTIRRGFGHFAYSRSGMIQKTRSDRRKRTRLVRPFKIINCCLKATSSRPQSTRHRIKLLNQVNKPKINQNMNPFL
jgi:hypothetical protein